MELGSGYRWNVPVVTYGFDQSFISYFGTNGMAAVESAIQILNDLPPASQLQLADYSHDTSAVNFAPEAQYLDDLKSQTLHLLLEHLGLADPTRYAYTLKQWSPEFAATATPGWFPNTGTWADWAYPEYVENFNFDPATLEASFYVNGDYYVANLQAQGNENFMNIFSADPYVKSWTAWASSSTISDGYFCTGLTYDDAGGLAYLFSTNNINYETLLPGITGRGANASSWVNGAWRPGVDKITFVAHPTDPGSGTFLAMTNCFIDTFVTNGNMVQQQLRRVVTQPDFLFSVADLFDGTFNSYHMAFARTGTTNWINNSALNGNPNGVGPGVIAPPVKITFANQGLQMYTFNNGSPGSDNIVLSSSTAAADYGDDSVNFGSFDGSTNPPVIYPQASVKTGTNQMMAHLWLFLPQASGGALTKGFTWSRASAFGTVYNVQTSTDIFSWTTLFTVTNTGYVANYSVNAPQSAARFYRMVPQ